MSEDEENSDDERARKRPKQRDITNTFFANELLREQTFPPAGTKRRASGRVAYAFGVKLPDLGAFPYDFDEVAQNFAASLSR